MVGCGLNPGSAAELHEAPFHVSCLTSLRFIFLISGEKKNMGAGHDDNTYFIGWL